MTPKQEKLIENYVRQKVKKMLKESVPNHDAEFLMRILKTAGPKISSAIRNLEKTIDKNSPEFERIKNIRKGWDEVAFGYGELYPRLTGKH